MKSDLRQQRGALDALEEGELHHLIWERQDGVADVFQSRRKTDFSVTGCLQFNNRGFFVPKFTLGSGLVGRNLWLAF